MTHAQVVQVIAEKEAVLKTLLAKWERDNESLFLLNKRINELALAIDGFKEKRDDLACIGGDDSCPCQDGDMCHYKGPNAWPIPQRA